MKKVYLVLSSGSDGDYVSTVFSTKKGAEKFLSAFSTDKDLDILECEVDKYLAKLESDYEPFIIRMDKLGNYLEWKLMKNALTDLRFEYRFEFYKYDDGSVCLSLIVNTFAKDLNHAKQIANEKRLELLALGNWR